MFAIAWQYLTGRAVATDPSDRQKAEWPPHPDRVFQALIAAWGGHGEAEPERQSLTWLAGLGAPMISAPEMSQTTNNDGAIINATQRVTKGAAPKTYVPVNDLSIDLKDEDDFNRKVEQAAKNAEKKDKDLVVAAASRAAGMIKSGLDMFPNRPARAERYFPSTVVGDATCALIWSDAEPSSEQRIAMTELCRAVTHIGHSSSLVRMWVAAPDEALPPSTWEPVADGRRAEIHLRVQDAGRVETLTQAFVSAVEFCKKRPGAPVPMPPRAPWQGYATALAAETPRGHFDHRLIILRRTGGDRIGLVQTLALTTALRDTLNRHATDVIRPLVSGHATDGAPSELPHLAIIPLPFVGSEHADGHVLGFALALPRDLPADHEEELWQALADAADKETSVVRVVAGSAGAVDLQWEDRPAPPQALRATRWCGPSTTWASVTPIVLDRSPPKRHADHDAWSKEQIILACTRQGLPIPIEIAILGTSAFTGAPPARAMPPWLRKDGTRRWHLHVRLIFPTTVVGPLLLGAGRYRGYGFCAPHAGDVL